jgi:hypothetical protein
MIVFKFKWSINYDIYLLWLLAAVSYINKYFFLINYFRKC